MGVSRSRARGQTGTEYMLVVSVVVVAVVAAAYVFVQPFQDGTQALGRRVKAFLDTGEVGGVSATTSGPIGLTSNALHPANTGMDDILSPTASGGNWGSHGTWGPLTGDVGNAGPIDHGPAPVDPLGAPVTPP